MDEPADLKKLLNEISRQLKRLGVDHDICAIQIMNESGSDFISVEVDPGVG